MKKLVKYTNVFLTETLEIPIFIKSVENKPISRDIPLVYETNNDNFGEFFFDNRPKIKKMVNF